jgi:hypothetical protein
VDSGDFTANGDVEIEDPTVYKVYKRRWIGVVIIMLLNIVSSWRFVPLAICIPVLYANMQFSWIAFAPVADFTRDYFGLSSSTPVNWLSTVVLFVYCVLSPVTAYVYHHHGVRLGVILSLKCRTNVSLLSVRFLLLLERGSSTAQQGQVHPLSHLSWSVKSSLEPANHSY